MSVIPMSDYERFIFDLKGFIVIPSALTDDELSTARTHVDRYSSDPDSLP